MPRRPVQRVQYEFSEEVKAEWIARRGVEPTTDGMFVRTLDGEWLPMRPEDLEAMRACDRAVLHDGTIVKSRYPETRPKILSFKFRECSLKEFTDGYDLLVHPPSEAGHKAIGTTLKAGFDLAAAAIPVYVVIEITDHPEAAFYAERLVVGRTLHGIRSEWVRPGLGTAHALWGLRMPIQSVEHEGSKLKLVCYPNKAKGVVIGLEGSLDDLNTLAGSHDRET